MFTLKFIKMKLPLISLLVAIVVEISQADPSKSLTNYWSSHLQGVRMPPSIKDYLPTVDYHGSISNQFVSNNNLNISEDVNIWKCHATQQPPNLTRDSTSLHFLEKDLSKSSNINLYPHFPGLNSIKGQFIPRSVIQRFPALESTNLPTILAQFSISPKSEAAKVIKNTIELCQFAAKDDNICVTSLESMIDFVQSTLGKNLKPYRVVQAISTTMDDKYFRPSSKELQPYRIVQVRKLSNLRDSAITCHKAEFPFAIFLCHQRPSTVPYMVTLEGLQDKTRIEAATVCHMDTSDWHPGFAGLVALKAVPGTPVCHFLNQKSVLWVV